MWFTLKKKISSIINCTHIYCVSKILLSKFNNTLCKIIQISLYYLLIYILQSNLNVLKFMELATNCLCSKNLSCEDKTAMSILLLPSDVLQEVY